MSFANPPAKRRRHDAASSTLSKPFKSPLRQRPPQSPEQPSPPSTTTTNPNTKDEPKPNPQETFNQPDTPPPQHPQNPAAAAAPTPPPSTTPKPRPNPKTKARANVQPTDPTHHALQTQHRTLQARLAALRSDLDTAAQAQRIEASAKASELQTLVAKWRAVAQDAAEEVFVGASERVGRMGGMEGYKERVRESKAAAARWDEEERSVEDEGEREEVKKEEEEKEKENEGEDEEFTMEFMLKTLNIDPKTIGYDCAGQRWVK
ncbi:hypothetical protein PHISP_03230 [Aspergillus sp. HF37]|nr:hypothetical protein PHISP_03230 [Aspergillus sp. HF37]